MVKWILLLIAVPVAEIIIYVQMGRFIGIPLTLTIILGISIFGVVLAKRQGLSTINRARSEIAQGRVPGNHLLDGLLILLGAVLLITPGLLTDLAGLFLLIPATRGLAREFLKRKIRSWLSKGTINTYFRFR